jgi:hypothetical protein
MHFDFLFIIQDYLSTFSKKGIFIEYVCPLIIAALSALLGNLEIQYHYIEQVVPFIGGLLGFTLAAITILATSDFIREKTVNYGTSYKINGRCCSMYELILTSFSYQIILEAVLCISFYLSLLFGISMNNTLCLLINTLFVSLTLSVLFATLRIVAMFYFIVLGSERMNSHKTEY